MTFEELEQQHHGEIHRALKDDADLYIIQYGQEYADFVSDNIEKCEDYCYDNNLKDWRVCDYRTGEIVLTL